jgi:hypothetical protein
MTTIQFNNYSVSIPGLSLTQQITELNDYDGVYQDIIDDLKVKIPLDRQEHTSKAKHFIMADKTQAIDHIRGSSVVHYKYCFVIQILTEKKTIEFIKIKYNDDDIFLIRQEAEAITNGTCDYDVYVPTSLD